MSLVKDGFYKAIGGVIGSNSYVLLAGGDHIAWGNGVNQIPYSNGAVNSNLNADMVDNEHASAFAHRQTWNNMIHSGNEYTWIAPAYSGGVWINYRTASGSTDGNITEYIFGKGNGSALATLNSTGTILTSSNWTSIVDGRYLPLSGGTMTGTPYINMPASAASISNNQPFGITYGRIQGYGDIFINADTDGSTSEYVHITSGYGAGTSGVSYGLGIGYYNLYWKGGVLFANTSNVGIGTTSPRVKLDVGGYDSSVIIGNTNGSPGVSTARKLRLGLATVGHTSSNYWAFCIDDTTSNSYLQIAYTESDTGLSLRHDGYLGIGTRTPDHKLTVAGVEHGISTYYGFNYHPAYQDGAGRPGLSISGWYPYIWLTGGNRGNGSHGATLTLAAMDDAWSTSGAFKGFTFGVPGYNATWMDLGYGSHNNPHYHGQDGYTSGWSGRIMRFEPSKVTSFTTLYVNDGHIARGNEHIVSPKGGSYSSNAFSETGYIIVRFPYSLIYCMMSVWIDIYSYSTNHSCSIHCGAYTYDSSFGHAPFARCIGRNLKVRFCYDSSYYYIVVGESDSVWYYPKFMVRDMLVGYSQPVSNWLDKDLYCYISSSLPGNEFTSIQEYIDTVNNNNSRYLRKDTNDTSGVQYTFTCNWDHAIQIGTIRGYGAGSCGGQYIHMYERVHIGSPNGWGSREAPSYGLSTYGGAWLATDTGNVGIGTTSPSYKLDVAGDIRATNNLIVSTNNVTGCGIIFADDGDIVDLNDAYCSMRFSYGVRIYSANRGGSWMHELNANGKLYNYGVIHRSYNSSDYFLTSDGGAKHWSWLDNYYLRLFRRINSNGASTNSGTIPPSILEFKNGYPIHPDPEFAYGYNDISVYDNNGSGATYLTRETSSTCGNSTGYVIKVTSGSGATPGYGGWYFADWCTVNTDMTCIFRALIPSGISVEWTSNSIGSGGTGYWLTEHVGTGKWEWYAYHVKCGTGSESNTFFFYVTTPCTWYISFANTYINTYGAWDGNARYVIGDNRSSNPIGALLQSGWKRNDNSPGGDTWIFLDTLGGTSSPWGFRHNQANNSIGFIGSGTEWSRIPLYSGISGYIGSALTVGANVDPVQTLDVRGNIVLGNSTGETHIYARTSSFNNPALSFYDDTSGWGTMVALGGGGCTVVGAGESAHEFAPYVRDENLYLTADANVNIFTNLDGGYGSRRHVAHFNTNGDTYLYGNLYLGANASNNFIAFYGNTGDAPGSYVTTFIGEHLWGGSESTELLFMKFNDVGNGTDGTTAYSSGPDRIRHLAHAHVFQIMTDTSQNDFVTMANSSAVETKFDIARYQLHAYAPLAIISDGTNSGYDGLVYMRHYSNNDWGLIVDKSQSYTYGVDIRAGGEYALKVGNGNTRLIGATIIGADATPSYTLDVRGHIRATENLLVSTNNTTGGGIILADDGDIVDLNDAYCSMRFSYGVRIFSANRGGSPVITLGNNNGSYIHITGNTSNNMAYNTSNPRLIFSEWNSQQVGIVYTDYDSYRGSKGLKIMDVNNDDTSNVWLEIQGKTYGPGFYHTSYGSSNYFLTSDGGARYWPDLYDGRYLRYEGWWNSGSGQNVDDAHGMVFAYGNHNRPGNCGIVATFEEYRGSSYRLQLAGDGWDNCLYFRNRSLDRGGWHTGWQRIYCDNYRPYADHCDWSDRTAHLLINDSTWWSNWYWSGQSGQPTWLWGSNDGTNMYIWNPSNFSVNYANSADRTAHLLINGSTWLSNWYWDGQSGQPTWLWGSNDGTNMYIWNPSNFWVAHASWADYTYWVNVQEKIHGGNEFNIVHDGYSSTMWFNYLPVNNRSGSANVSQYIFGNGHAGLAELKALKLDLTGGSIEIYGTNPFIDFHGSNYSGDYRSRLINWGSNNRLTHESITYDFTGYLATVEGNQYNLVCLGVFDLYKTSDDGNSWTTCKIAGMLTYATVYNQSSSDAYPVYVYVYQNSDGNYSRKGIPKIVSAIPVIQARWCDNKPRVINWSTGDWAPSGVECTVMSGSNFYSTLSTSSSGIGTFTGQYIAFTSPRPWGYDDGSNGLAMDGLRCAGNTCIQRIRVTLFGYMY